MSNQNQKQTPSIDVASAEKTQPELKVYVRPELRELGDVRGVTLGGSPGAGESGFVTLFKP